MARLDTILPPPSDHAPDTERDSSCAEVVPETQRSSRLGVVVARESLPPSVEIVDRSGLRPAVARDDEHDHEWLDDGWLEDALAEDDAPPDTLRAVPPTLRCAG